MSARIDSSRGTIAVASPCLVETLTGERNELLGALSSETKALLDPHLKRVAITRGAALHEPGVDIDYVYFPIGGMIMLAVVMLTGEVIGTATVGREGAVGTKAGFVPNCAHTRALVQISGFADRIATAAFRAALSESSALTAAIADYTDSALSKEEVLAMARPFIAG